MKSLHIIDWITLRILVHNATRGGNGLLSGKRVHRLVYSMASGTHRRTVKFDGYTDAEVNMALKVVDQDAAAQIDVFYRSLTKVSVFASSVRFKAINHYVTRRDAVERVSEQRANGHDVQQITLS